MAKSNDIIYDLIVEREKDHVQNYIIIYQKAEEEGAVLTKEAAINCLKLSQYQLQELHNAYLRQIPNQDGLLATIKTIDEIVSGRFKR